jgi:hypothetical protein
MAKSKKTAIVILPAEKKSILKWIEDLDKQGKELSIGWEGGGDSGWAYFQIDGDNVDNEYTEAILDYMYSELNYGGWAGEFNASGTAIYDVPTRKFEGTDYYGEDGNDVLDTTIIINVPKKLWFDTLHVECESNYDETPNISVQFIVKNGFLLQEHSDICHNLEEVLKDDFDALFSTYESTDSCEFRGCNDSWILERKDAVEEDDMLVFTITKVEINTIDTSERTVVLTLTDDIVNNIDEKLNETENAN